MGQDLIDARELEVRQQPPRVPLGLGRLAAGQHVEVAQHLFHASVQ